MTLMPVRLDVKNILFRSTFASRSCSPWSSWGEAASASKHPDSSSSASSVIARRYLAMPERCLGTGHPDVAEALKIVAAILRERAG